MAKSYSGITDVAYSTDGSSFTSITGKIAADSTITPTTITNDTTQSRVFGGESLEATIGFYDQADYATLKTAMRADTDYFWRMTFVDGTTQTTSEAHPFQVVKVINPDKRTGLNRFNLSFFFATDDETLTTG